MLSKWFRRKPEPVKTTFFESAPIERYVPTVVHGPLTMPNAEPVFLSTPSPAPGEPTPPVHPPVAPPIVTVTGDVTVTGAMEKFAEAMVRVSRQFGDLPANKLGELPANKQAYVVTPWEDAERVMGHDGHYRVRKIRIPRMTACSSSASWDADDQS